MLSRSVKRLGERRRRHWDLGGGRKRMFLAAVSVALLLLLLLLALVLLHSISVVSSMIEWVRREAWRHSLRAAVPSCPASPWKADENLRGDCRAELKPARPPGSGGGAAADAATTVAECARSCCDDPACVSWQHRRDVGCLRGGDVRLGMEKDGVPAWCSDHPPHRWRGQFLLGGSRNDGAEDGDRGMGGTSSANVVESRKLACDESTWNPEEEVGQCFGLGDVRPNKASGSAVECMRACCGDPTCGAWQWNEVVRSAHPRRCYSSRPVR